MAQQLSTNTFVVANFVVSPNPTQGTHTTITAALAASSSGDNIYVREGTYTETFTVVPGVNITALDENVVVVGTVTCSAAGALAVINNISIQATSGNGILMSGSNACNLFLRNCFVTSSAGTAVDITNTNAASTFYSDTCTILGGTSQAAFNIASTTGFLATFNQTDINDSGSLVSSTMSSGAALFVYCKIDTPLTTSGNATMSINFSELGEVAAALSGYQPLTLGTSGNQAFNYSTATSGSGATSVINMSGGSTVNINSGTLAAQQPTVISGTGTVRYNLMAIPAGTAIAGTITLVPLTVRLGTYSTLTTVTSGMSPYTVLSSDDYLSVDCSAGPVTLLFSNTPNIGQVWVVKDATGNAATHNISISTVGGTDTIDGATTYVMSTAYQSTNLIGSTSTTYQVY